MQSTKVERFFFLAIFNWVSGILLALISSSNISNAYWLRLFSALNNIRNCKIRVKARIKTLSWYSVVIFALICCSMRHFSWLKVNKTFAKLAMSEAIILNRSTEILH